MQLLHLTENNTSFLCPFLLSVWLPESPRLPGFVFQWLKSEVTHVFKSIMENPENSNNNFISGINWD